MNQTDPRPRALSFRASGVARMTFGARSAGPSIGMGIRIALAATVWALGVLPTLPSTPPAGSRGTTRQDPPATLSIGPAGASERNAREAARQADPSQAQPASPLGASAPVAAAQDEGLTRSDTPRGAIRAYLLASRAGDYERAARYLDLEAIDPSDRATEGPRLARHLKFVLDRKYWFDLETISESQSGDLEDGLPPDRERVGFFETPRGPLEIRLKRVPESPGSPNLVWKFGPIIVAAIPELWDMYGLGLLGEYMPSWLYRIRIRELELWQFLGFLVLGLLAYAAAWAIELAGFRYARHIARRRGAGVDAEESPFLPVATQSRLLLATMLFFAGTVLLKLSIPARANVSRMAGYFVVLVMAWMMFKVTDIFFTRVRERLLAEERRSGLAIVALARRVSKILIVTLAVIVLLQQFGFQVGGLLAGLGIGGAAIALASQKTLANVFGGLTLGMDQPIRVGDTCRFGTTVGVVEDVGLRSTRVRTLERSVLTVPNADMAEFQLENLSMRDQMRMLTTIGLRYETTPAQLRAVLEALRNLLSSDPRVSPENLRVRFVGFGAYTLDVEVQAYIRTSDYLEFLAIREEIFLNVMDLLSECGTGFAFPSQTVYMTRDRAPEAAEPGPSGRT